MSVQTQIDRLTKAKGDLKASITGKGVAVSDDALISDYPALVDSIHTGSDLKVQDSKAVSYTSNGSYDVLPDSGYDGMAKVTVDVNVASPTPVQTVDLDTGISFSNSSFTTLPFTLTGGGNRSNMSSMFNNCQTLTSLDLSNCDTSKVTTMSYMFSDCHALTSFDLSNCDTSKVTNMYYMFSGCYRLTSLDLSNFNTSNVTTMSYMFRSCNALTSLDLSNFNTSKVTDMSSMFSNCRALTSLDLSNFNTSKVTKMNSMFSNCRALTSLDLSNFNTSNVTTMNYMFRACEALTTVKVINCDSATQQKILTQLQTDIKTKTWTLGEDGIIRSS